MPSDLELSIMSCLLLKPDLMKSVIVEDKHFVKHQRMWKFLKAVYEKFETFDINLIYSICQEKDKYKVATYIVDIVEIEVTTANFNLYQQTLIENYNKSKHDKYLIEKIYDEANRLCVGKISVEEFFKNVEQARQIAEKI